MSKKYRAGDPKNRCVLCGAKLPLGVWVALFENEEAEEPFIGNFCSPTHAFEVLENMTEEGRVSMPDSLFLGVRVARELHDKKALSSIMADIARRAVQAAVENEESGGDRTIH